MKKTLSIIALSIIGFGLVSCKKENKETQSTATTDSAAVAAPVINDSAATPATSEAAAPVSNEPSTSVALSENSFDFGKIKKGDKVQHVYEITNTGKNPLIIDKVEVSCGCTTASKPEKPILPGKTDKIEIVFHPKVGQLNQQEKTVTVTANTEPKTAVLVLKANVQKKS